MYYQITSGEDVQACLPPTPENDPATLFAASLTALVEEIGMDILFVDTSIGMVGLICYTLVMFLN